MRAATIRPQVELRWIHKQMTEALNGHRRVSYTEHPKEKRYINLPEAFITVPESAKKIFLAICTKEH
jgi:hypothetical protein